MVINLLNKLKLRKAIVLSALFLSVNVNFMVFYKYIPDLRVKKINR